MDKKQVIEYLKERLKEIPYLASLPYNNNEYPLWRNQIQDILEAVFGRDSTEYKRFFNAWPTVRVAGRAQQSYAEELQMRETAILSVVKKYETLGIEEKPAAIAGLPVNDNELPSYLFDKMQFHPDIVTASKSLFETGHYTQAIFEAFKAVNNFVKKKTGLSLDGKALMSKVFKEDAPIIKLNELVTQSDKDEQEGFMLLFMGAMVGIRNPKAHDNVIQTDPFRTLEYLGFASLLMKRVEEGILVKTSPPRKKWNLRRFLNDTQNRCSHEEMNVIREMYNFTKENADSIYWGTGASWGSFTFRKSGHGITASIFTVYSDSSLTINFGQMKGREIKEEVLESLRVELNRIPEIKIPRDAVTIGKWHDISVEPLMNAENLNTFQEAVLSLCKNIESGSSN